MRRCEPQPRVFLSLKFYSFSEHLFLPGLTLLSKHIVPVFSWFHRRGSVPLPDDPIELLPDNVGALVHVTATCTFHVLFLIWFSYALRLPFVEFTWTKTCLRAPSGVGPCIVYMEEEKKAGRFSCSYMQEPRKLAQAWGKL